MNIGLGRKCALAVQMQRKREEAAQTRSLKPPQPYSEFSKGMECSSPVLVPYTREWPPQPGVPHQPVADGEIKQGTLACALSLAMW